MSLVTMFLRFKDKLKEDDTFAMALVISSIIDLMAIGITCATIVDCVKG